MVFETQIKEISKCNNTKENRKPYRKYLYRVRNLIVHIKNTVQGYITKLRAVRGRVRTQR